MKKNKKTVVITGASKGIGKSIAKHLLNKNYQIIGISRTHSINHENYISIRQDLKDTENLIKAINSLKENYSSIKAVISNAGTGSFKKLENFSIREINEFITLNLTTHIILAKSFINYFKKKKSGYFIFNGSEASNIGGKKATLYSAAKHGLLGLAKSLRLECNDSGIRVSIINAGMVKSSFFESLDFEPGENIDNSIKTKDIAELIFFLLASSKSINYFDINLDPLKKVIKFKKK